MRAFFGLVGLAMFLGLGAAWVGSFRELEALSEAPRVLTVHDATTAPSLDGVWAELTDVRLPCAVAEQRASTTPYRLGFGATEGDRVIVRGHLECSETRGKLRGVLDVGPAGGIAELDFPGFGFDRWPTPNQTVLTPTSPDEVREGLWTLPPFAFFGLIIAAFYWRPKPPPTSTFATLERSAGDAPWTNDERVLPAGPLRFASSSIVDRVFVVAGLINIAWIFFTLAWLSGGWLGWLFFGALGLVMVLGGARLVGNWRSHANFDAVRHEGFARLLSEEPVLANGVDVGNRRVRFLHPLSGEEIERMRTANEQPMLIIDGHLFVVWASDPKALIVVAEGFFPFDLEPVDVRASLRRLSRMAAARG